MKLPEQVFPSYLEKQPHIDAAWTLCEQRFAAWPASLSRLATQFLTSITDETRTHRSYFSQPLAPPLLYMPIWLFDALGSEFSRVSTAPTHLIDILAGTIQGYLYIRIQDDILDGANLKNQQLLLLGNACFSGFLAAYAQALGPHAARFGAKFDAAILDFSRWTLEEQQAVRTDAPYVLETFVAHADKVAFARVPLLAVALLAGREDLDDLIRRLVHQLGIAYGIVNDALGWPRDLRCGQRTWLLSEAGVKQADLERLRQAMGTPAETEVWNAVVEPVRVALYDRHLLREVLAQATAYQREAARIAAELGLSSFGPYTEERIAWLESVRGQTAIIALQRALGAQRT